MATISPERDLRRRALAVAKLAVRAYARDPSAANARGVELAWRRVRRIDGIARWQRPPFHADGISDPMPHGS